jgi:hypothetical protein
MGGVPEVERRAMEEGLLQIVFASLVPAKMIGQVLDL